MKAAIYTRYSSNNQKESSTEDQARNCRTLIEREGWALISHFKDEAVSGSTNKRPDYQAMLAAAKRREFDILIVDKLSRFSRDLIEQETACNALTDRRVGVRIIAVNDSYDSSIAKSKMMRQVKGMVNELHGEDHADNIHRGLTGQVLKGYWAGGRCYGYDLKQDTDPHKLSIYGTPEVIGTRLFINEVQAQIVRGIFTRYAEGSSARAIAEELNARGIPSPGANYNRVGGARGKWLASVISSDQRRCLGILNNRLYRGEYVWNRTRWEKNKDPELKSTHMPYAHDEADWVTSKSGAVPRIVDEALWNRVKSRQAHTARTIGERVKLGLAGANNPNAGRGPKYLLSGVLVCADCGQPLNKSDRYSYVCATFRNGGRSACANDVTVKRAIAETKLLTALKDELLSPANVERLKKKVRHLQTQRQATDTHERRELGARLGEQGQVIDNIMNAIKAGIFTASTKAALEAAEREKTRIGGALAALPSSNRKVVPLNPIPGLLGRVQRLVEGFEARAYAEGGPTVARAREDIKALLGTVPVSGVIEGGKKVPYALIAGAERVLLRASGGGNAFSGNCGRGDRI